jgi:hypothetical protein
MKECQELVTQSEGKLTLVPLDDKRVEVEVKGVFD